VTASVQHILDADLRPLLHFHGGDVRIADVTTEGKVRLEYVGACHGCQLQVVTHFVTVRQRLLKVEGVTDVVARGVHISDDAKQRIASATRSP
jgi:Fe-S cluster biogenesis protein NfuA